MPSKPSKTHRRVFYKMFHLLAKYEQTSTYVASYWESIKSSLRSWLGPEIPNYYIFSDGNILPSTVRLPYEYEFGLETEIYIYYSETKRIANLKNTTMEGRFRPLQYIGIQINYGNESIDISDWLGELRMNPNTVKIPIRQILMLWFLTQNRYIPLDKATFHVVNSDGTEEDITLTSS